MEGDLISRSLLLKEAEDWLCDSTDLRCFTNLIEIVPAVDAEPIRHGTWENYPNHTYRRCSICKTELEKPKFNIRSNYCPNCGAKMDGQRSSK